LENLHLASLVGQVQPKRVTSGPGVKSNPALWTEGNLGRLFFSAAGKLESLALDLDRLAEAKAGPPVGQGTEASWSPDGHSVVWTERSQVSATQSNFALKLRDVVNQTDTRLFALPGMMLRNPACSPDGRHIAFYARPLLQPSWRLYVIPAPRRLGFAERAGDPAGGELPAATASNTATLVAQDVRVEEHFQNVGPSWDPRGDRLWFFSRAEEQEYYPLRWTMLDGARRGEVGYPRKLTTGLDVAVNPNMNLRTIAFCAIENLSQDVIVLVLSHENE
jgi:hypothetical protein